MSSMGSVLDVQRLDYQRLPFHQQSSLMFVPRCYYCVIIQ